MRNEKIHLINYVGGLLKDSDFVYFVSYKGLTVKEMSDFRSKIAAANGKCRVIKNTLIRKAAQLNTFEDLGAVKFENSTMVITGSGDPSAPAKVIQEYCKSNDKLAPACGLFEGALLSKAEVTDIASLPSREVLYSMLLGVLQGPSRNLVSVLNAKASSIVNVLNAYKNKQEQ